MRPVKSSTALNQNQTQGLRTTPSGDAVLKACLGHPDYHLYELNFRHDAKQQLALDHLRFLHVNRATFDLSAFLDNRIYAPRKSVVDIPAAQLLQHWPEAAMTGPAHFIFHTAFCCSTLLSRLLQAPGYTVALREPWALRALAEIKRAGHVPGRLPEPDWRQLVDVVLGLLSKTYHRREHVVIKPSNLCNLLVDDVMRARPRSRGVWLSNGLDEFLISVLKKQPETQAKMGGLAALMAAGSTLTTAVGEVTLSRLDALQAAAVVWQLQQEHMNTCVQRWPGRLLTLQAADLIQRPGAVCERVSDFLELTLPSAYFSGAGFQAALHHHAKAPQLNYNASLRADENRRIRFQHQERLHQVLAWHQQHFPHSPNDYAVNL